MIHLHPRPPIHASSRILVLKETEVCVEAVVWLAAMGLCW